MMSRCLYGILIITFLNGYTTKIHTLREDYLVDSNWSTVTLKRYLTSYFLSKLEDQRVEEIQTLPVYKETEDYLINTLGCYIPNYMKTITFYETPDYHGDCGQRFVFVRAVPEKRIQFTISAKHLKYYKRRVSDVKCCYQFARRSRTKASAYPKSVYSRCIEFRDGTRTKLRAYTVSVSCYTLDTLTKKQLYFYIDTYLIYTRNKIITESTKETRPDDGHWNVLMVGIDTISRGRAYRYLPKTIKFLNDNKWINYRGYNKISASTVIILTAILTGKNIQRNYNDVCSSGSIDCNKFMMWNHYKKAGYTTASGEDCTHMHTFGDEHGIYNEPTDYYVRPFFFTGEWTNGNVQCTGKQSSVKQLLNYAFDFTNAYRKGKFFAFFWFNGIGHDYGHRPRLHDKDLQIFLKKLSANEAMNKTFVFFFSDHGQRFGPEYFMKNIGAYYAARLPMMFIHVPFRFRKLHRDKYYNMMLNENRLTVPYDFHATLWDILKLSNSSVEVMPPEGCPQCTSWFNEMSPYRTCQGANIPSTWCACRKLRTVSLKKIDDKNKCVAKGVTFVRTITKAIVTKPCTTCSPLRLKKVLRMHVTGRSNDSRSLCIVAFKMTPGDMAYEATVETDGIDYRLLTPAKTITAYGPDEGCVVRDKDREYCICSKIKNCNVKLKL